MSSSTPDLTAAAAHASAPNALPTPPVWRRMACFTYEGVLLFGVVVIAGLAYSVLSNQRHALQGVIGMQAFLFVVLGAYFVFFWSRRGQTLAMLTWHVKLVRTDGSAVGPGRALVRYLLCWLWFVPALVALQVAGLKGGWPASGALIAGVLAYAMLARLHPDRQFWHDAACSTRLVHWKAPSRRDKT
jgi:uncharacterized RDD family membrane protein YckC